MVAMIDRAQVDAQNIAFFQPAFTGYPVDDLVIDGSADRPWKSVITL